MLLRRATHAYVRTSVPTGLYGRLDILRDVDAPRKRSLSIIHDQPLSLVLPTLEPPVIESMSATLTTLVLHGIRLSQSVSLPCLHELALRSVHIKDDAALFDTIQSARALTSLFLHELIFPKPLVPASAHTLSLSYLVSLHVHGSLAEVATLLRALPDPSLELDITVRTHPREVQSLADYSDLHGEVFRRASNHVEAAQSIPVLLREEDAPPTLAYSDLLWLTEAAKKRLKPLPHSLLSFSGGDSPRVRYLNMCKGHDGLAPVLRAVRSLHIDGSAIALIFRIDSTLFENLHDIAVHASPLCTSEIAGLGCLHWLRERAAAGRHIRKIEFALEDGLAGRAPDAGNYAKLKEQITEEKLVHELYENGELTWRVPQ
jgi:hypothetical protein